MITIGFVYYFWPKQNKSGSVIRRSNRLRSHSPMENFQKYTIYNGKTYNILCIHIILYLNYQILQNSTLIASLISFRWAMVTTFKRFCININHKIIITKRRHICERTSVKPPTVTNYMNDTSCSVRIKLRSQNSHSPSSHF